MLKNYFKIAFKVMMRNKLFTFISLFGISFTLLFIVVVTAFIDHTLGPVEPETQLRRTLSVTMGLLESESGGTTLGPLFSPYFFKKYVKTLETPQKISLSSYHHPVVVYLENKKLKINLKYTDSEFWDILDFAFLEGRSYDKEQVDNIEPVAVINERVRDEYFLGQEAVGRFMEIEGTRFRVIGVVKNVSLLRIMPYADVWVPYLFSKSDLDQVTLIGGFPGWFALVMAGDRGDFPQIKAEFQNKLQHIEFPEGRFKRILTNTSSYEEALARQIFRREDGNIGPFLAILLFLMVLFMILPAINLVNINISRIIERSSEIGIRKSFGASSLVLVGQFLIENIIITILGSILSLILAAIILGLINNSGYIAHSHLVINYRVFLTCILIAVFFGIYSGVYPAYKMSRLQPAEALQGVRR